MKNKFVKLKNNSILILLFFVIYRTGHPQGVSPIPLS